MEKITRRLQKYTPRRILFKKPFNLKNIYSTNSTNYVGASTITQQLVKNILLNREQTITRKIIENQNQATAGQRAVNIQFSGDYNLTKQLMLRIYFDRRVNTPFVSTSFPTANTNAGFAIRFQLR